MTITAMKQALEALEKDSPWREETIGKLRLAIEQAEKQEAWKPSDTAYRPGGLPQDFIKHEVDSFDDWSEWVCPDPEQYFMKCCYCGLVHEMQFRVARYLEGDECELVVDPAIQAQFRMRRIEQAEKQEPVAWWREDGSICTDERQAGDHDIPLYTHRRLIPRDYTAPPQQKKQEPVAWLYRDEWKTLKLSQITPPPTGSFPVYTAPPQRQPLTREQVLECEREADAAYVATRADELRPSWASIFARAVERKHGIGGGE